MQNIYDTNKELVKKHLEQREHRAVLVTELNIIGMAFKNGKLYQQMQVSYITGDSDRVNFCSTAIVIPVPTLDNSQIDVGFMIEEG